MATPRNCPNSSKSVSPVTRASAPAAMAVPRTGISPGSENASGGSGAGSTSRTYSQRSREISLARSVETLSFEVRFRSSSSRMYWLSTTSCVRRQVGTKASQRPRAANAASSTLVSITSFTKRPGRHPRQLGSPGPPPREGSLRVGHGTALSADTAGVLPAPHRWRPAFDACRLSAVHAGEPGRFGLRESRPCATL
jgi:hypothetical protein